MKKLLARIGSVVLSFTTTLQLLAGTGVLNVTAHAANGTVIGPYTIVGGMRNIDYKLESNVLHIMSDIPMTISNTDINTVSTIPITVDANVNADITLAGVNIAPTGAAAIDVSLITESETNVTITIADATVNTLRGGENYAGLSKGNCGHLFIKGETVGDGVLSAYGGKGGAGIGGEYRFNKDGWSGNQASGITILSGVVTAVGGENAAGIGGGYALASRDYSGSSVGSDITISGGIVNAQGGNKAAGIGGGYGGSQGSSREFTCAGTSLGERITISGGIVNTQGGTSGAGIGGGYAMSTSSRDAGSYSRGKLITISGGIVNARGGGQAAGIGGGEAMNSGSNNSAYSEGVSITISGGIVNAQGGDRAAGIGGGCAKSHTGSDSKSYSGCGVITISGGIVNAQGGSYGAGIGSGYAYCSYSANNCYFECDKIYIEKSSVKAIGGSVDSYVGANIGTGSYGSNDGTPVLPCNSDSESLYLAVIENPNGSPIEIDGETFPIMKHSDDDFNVYAYLTDAYHTVTVGDISYAVNPRTGKKLPLPEVTAPTPVSNLVYNENEQTLIEAGSTSNGTMMYALDKAGPYSEELPKGLNADTYTVWYKSQGDDTTVASTNPKSIEVTIDRVPWDFTQEQLDSITATGITYEQTLADSVITGDSAYAGIYEWKEPDTKPTVPDSDTTGFPIIFTPTDTNYDSAEAACTLTVSKKGHTFSSDDIANLSAADLIYGQTLSESVITGPTPVVGSYRWVDGDAIPAVKGTNNYSVEFVPDDITNYEISPVGDIHVNVNKADPIITAEQLAAMTVSDITYGQTLADSTITAEATTSGVFEWTDGTIAPTVADSLTTSYEITFTPDDTDNYNVRTVNVMIKVNKAPIILSEAIRQSVSATDITYEQLLSNSTLTGDVPQAGHWEWKNPDIKPSVADSGVTAFEAIFVPDDINYATADATVTLIINKKAFTFTQDDIDSLSASELTYGQTLADSIISGTTPAAGKYQWVDDTVQPSVNGANNYSVKFVPDDTDNYEIVTVGDIHVTVNKADPVVTKITASGIVYEQTLADSTLDLASVTPGSVSWVDNTIAPVVSDSNLTEYEVLFTPDDTDNYNTKTFMVTLLVDKAVPDVPADMLDGIKATGIKYGQTLNDSVLSYDGLETFDGVLVWTNPEIKPMVTDSDKTEYLVTYRPTDTANYKTLTFKTKLQVDKGQAPGSLKDFETVVAPPTTDSKGETDLSDMINLSEWTIVGVRVDDPHGIFAAPPAIDGKKLKYTFDTSKSHKDETADVIATIRSRDYEDFEIKVTVKAIDCSHTDVRHNVGKKAATCSEEGYTGDTVCNICNCTVEYGQTIATTKHHGVARDSISATCMSDGFSGDVYCKDCNAFIESGHVTSKLPHTAGEPVIIIEPTFTTEGQCKYYCERCGAYIKTDVVPKLSLDGHEHKWSADYRSDDHDHWRECSECNGLSVRESHRYDDGEYITATCTTEGTVKYVCTVCGMTVTKTEVPGHRPVWKQDGDKHYKVCAVCGLRFETESHVFDNWVETIAPTETVLGTYKHSCKLCGYVEETRASRLPASGEKPSEGNGSTTESGASKNPNKGDNPDTGVETEGLKLAALALVAGATILLSKKCKI